MKEKEKFIVLDTETANTLEEPICYDIGFAVVDTDGTVFETRSFAIAEFFLDENLINSAYYSEKIPTYWEEIKNGERKLVKMSTAKRILREICDKYDIKVICAHNARFDNLSCNTTQRYYTSSKNRYFFPSHIEIWDTLKMARQTFSEDENYIKFCNENGYLTNHKKPRLRFTAEILNRYISGDNEFEEVHKGLADVMIEKEIFAECWRRGCRNGNLWEKKGE